MDIAPLSPIHASTASATDTLKMLVRYKAWANGLTFRSVMELPEGEALRQRPTRFGNMVHTLNHVYVVDDISGIIYKERNTVTPPATPTIRPQLANYGKRFRKWTAGMSIWSTPGRT